MAKDDLKKLRSKNPEERKAGIRAVAKSLDRNALVQLAVMAGDDPDPDIRKLAQQAGVYIRQKTGDIQPEPSSDKKIEKVKRITVDEASAQKARQLVQYAGAQLDGGDKAKAVKALVKAIDLDPNLRHDSFYISLSESFTQLEGDEAIRALRDESRIESAVQKDVQIKLDKATQAHREEIGSASGRDVLFDMGLFTLVSVVIVVVLLFLTVYQAGQYQTNLDANKELLQTAFAEQGTPRIVWRDGTVGNNLNFDLIRSDVSAVFATIPQAPPAPLPPKTDILQPTEFFEQTTLPYWTQLGIGIIIVRGLGLGMIALMAALLFIGVVHLFAQTFFGGDGRFAYTAHRLFTLFTGRAILFAIIGFAGIILYFSGGGNETNALIFIGIFALFAFFTVLSSATTIKRAYRFGIFSALIVLIVALASAVVLGGLAGFLFTQAV
ncbi:MAG: hypothetical protein CUN52_11725 [Phototrophicales bacterium]|nr:MAG: hypothetical protein CUN52_11725 [Phototrophicales bacterium]